MASVLKAAVILAVVLFLAFKGSNGYQYPFASGKVAFSDGSTCMWFERQQTLTSWAMILSCMCKDENNKLQEFACQYEGDLDSCSEWKQDSQTFLDSRVEQLLGKGQFMING